MSIMLSRRAVLLGTGALTLAFSLPGARAQTAASEGDMAAPERKLPGSLDGTPRLNAWIRIDANGAVTILTGKAELGQGLRTAILQIAAEELKVPFDALALVTADTGRTANEGYTAGSHSMQDSGTAIRNAAAQVREILIQEAARRLSVPAERLHAADGAVVGAGNIHLGYGELVGAELLEVDAQPTSKLTAASEFTVMNRSIPRVDIPGKVTGGDAYVQDRRPQGMLHARMIRPPSYGAEIIQLDSTSVEAMPRVLKVLRDRNFLAVVAVDEWTALQAMRRLSTLVTWSEQAELPDSARLADALTALPSHDTVILDVGKPGASGKVVEGRFAKPYLAHGSIGPSCAVAEASGGTVTVWTHTQGVYPLRQAIAGMLKLPLDKVRCIHTEGAGCYGHNGADDVGADAALIAAAMPGRPVRVQWMREQEHSWEPFGPGMVTSVRAVVGDAGTITDWHYEVWSQSHMMRPGEPGTLLAARDKRDPAPPPPPIEIAQPEGGGDRNAIPLYRFPNSRVVTHFLREMPLRGSSMRSLGGYLNVLSIESTMDDLARASGQDPVDFRLRFLEEDRARAVVERAAADFGWSGRPPLPSGGGYGFGFARYKNLEAYCAIALEIFIDPEAGDVRIRRVSAAVDTGEVVNPDGIRNQIEGGIIQSTSWTLFEQVTFDSRRITSFDWSSYPILRFSSVPERLDVAVIDRPGAPFLGVAEAAQGPAGSALANAIRDACGQRLRQLPFTPARIRQAFGR
ncbi:xanthine dehydrogenase family protein molybdopterin-binding subunit [Mesorhizobium shangrilense]|uniref:Molybdopterin cofactor-binding domain-containing protein n=1 Tax=Mesorhizobium shangrilense TaxID=460060 RepID=A0ABV2DEV7_9HYPH